MRNSECQSWRRQHGGNEGPDHGCCVRFVLVRKLNEATKKDSELLQSSKKFCTPWFRSRDLWVMSPTRYLCARVQVMIPPCLWWSRHKDLSRDYQKQVISRHLFLQTSVSCFFECEIKICKGCVIFRGFRPHFRAHLWPRRHATLQAFYFANGREEWTPSQERSTWCSFSPPLRRACAKVLCASARSWLFAAGARRTISRLCCFSLWQRISIGIPIVVPGDGENAGIGATSVLRPLNTTSGESGEMHA